MIATRRGAPGARYFQEYVADSGAYLRDVDGLGDGFAPSLYCHQRDWLNANKWVPSSCERIRGEQNCAAKTTCAWKEKTNECVGKSQCTECRRWSTGDALFRDHFECFLAPPLDEWFGFDALPPAGGRRAVAKAYAAVDRDALVDCGAADGELRVVVHVRLGDLIHPDLSGEMYANASAEINQATQLAFGVATKGKRLDKLFSSSPVHNPPHVHAADDYGRGCGRKKKATMGCFARVVGAPCARARARRSAAAAKRALARNWTRYEALAAFTEVLWRPSAAVRATTAAMRSALDLPRRRRRARRPRAPGRPRS
ncbi:hypothetical protein SO694_00002228 [Aureococcus anophagefferens]|uniref:Uncharacterized protein n=1 Tax=Aureococcus anophagefferens TaxID=44056 RepID=A0ABR1GCZ4_AURAN